jgi:hypothetical protein
VDIYAETREPVTAKTSETGAQSNERTTVSQSAGQNLVRDSQVTNSVGGWPLALFHPGLLRKPPHETVRSWPACTGQRVFVRALCCARPVCGQTISVTVHSHAHTRTVTHSHATKTPENGDPPKTTLGAKQAGKKRGQDTVDDVCGAGR